MSCLSWPAVWIVAGRSGRCTRALLVACKQLAEAARLRSLRPIEGWAIGSPASWTNTAALWASIRGVGCEYRNHEESCPQSTPGSQLQGNERWSDWGQIVRGLLSLANQSNRRWSGDAAEAVYSADRGCNGCIVSTKPHTCGEDCRQEPVSATKYPWPAHQHRNPG